MLDKLKALLLGSTLLFAAPAFSAEWNQQDMNQTIDQTNFMVNQGCSGTLLDLEHQYILTANHCVSQQYETREREVVDDDGKVKTEKYRHMAPGTVSQYSYDNGAKVKTETYRMKLRAVDANADLALVEVLPKLPNTRISRLSCTEPKRGDKAYVVGNPMGVLYSSVTLGLVSGDLRNYETLDIEGQEGPLLQISSGVIGGNSGGAVYNDRGEIIGVTVLGSRVNEILGFAVPGTTIKSFLKTNNLEALYAHCNGETNN